MARNLPANNYLNIRIFLTVSLDIIKNYFPSVRKTVTMTDCFQEIIKDKMGFSLVSDATERREKITYLSALGMKRFPLPRRSIS